jgi:hypothetical protein
MVSGDTQGDLMAHRYRRFLMVSILALLMAIGALNSHTWYAGFNLATAGHETDRMQVA